MLHDNWGTCYLYSILSSTMVKQFHQRLGTLPNYDHLLKIMRVELITLNTVIVSKIHIRNDRWFILIIKNHPEFNSILSQIKVLRKTFKRVLGDFQGGSVVKNLPANAGVAWRCRFNPWVRKIPWRRKWQPTPVFLSKNLHGQKNLAGYSPHLGSGPETPRIFLFCFYSEGRIAISYPSQSLK